MNCLVLLSLYTIMSEKVREYELLVLQQVVVCFSSSQQRDGKKGKCGKRNKIQRNDKSPPHIILILADDLGWNEVIQMLTFSC